MSRVAVVVNRRARSLALASPLLRALTKRRPGVRVRETGDTDELRDFAERVEPDEVVVLAGGDGSYMAGVSALARSHAVLPRVALAPGGTVCTVARNWGFRGDAAAYADRLLDAIAEDRAVSTPRPTLAVAERVGFIFGAGLVARFIETYEQDGARGYGGAARIVARIFAGSVTGGRLARRVLSPVPCAVEVDGRAAPFERVSLVCASVVKNLGLHMMVCHRAAEETKRFHVVATPLGPAALGPQMPLVLAGRPLLGKHVDTLAERLVLRFREGEGAWVLDGDLLRGDRVEVRAGPVLTVLGL
jgi:diacylglycerol kinase (ATP)